MQINIHELLDYDIPTVLRYGSAGLVKDIDPMFFDALQDYIDEQVEAAKEEVE